MYKKCTSSPFPLIEAPPRESADDDDDEEEADGARLAPEAAHLNKSRGVVEPRAGAGGERG